MLEHELSGMFDVAHGAGLSALWPSWARYTYARNIPRFAQFATKVMCCEPNFADLKETALAGISALERFFQDIGMPISIRELGVENLDDSQIMVMADKCSGNGDRTIGKFVELKKEDMIHIFHMAKG